MNDLVSSLPFSGRGVLAGAAFVIAMFAGSIALVAYFLIRLPPTYFQPAHERHFMAGRHRAIRWCGIIAKNLVGLMLVVLGIVLSVPGIPGQGILTLLVGFLLLDFPGKRALEYKVVSQPKLLRAINALRKKFSRPPLVLK